MNPRPLRHHHHWPLQVVRALAAAIVLATVIAGAPIALLVMTGSPLPGHLPGVADVNALLARPDDGVLLLGALKLLGWGAWAAFTASAAVEIGARLRGHQVAPHLRGLGGVQRLTATLIASLWLTAAPATAAAALAEPLPPVTKTAPPHPLLHPPGHHRTATPADGRALYRVEAGDSLAGIAEHELGDAKRWPRIWALNAFHRQADGRVFTDADRIQPGWRLRLPTRPSRSPANPDHQASRVVHKATRPHLPRAERTESILPPLVAPPAHQQLPSPEQQSASSLAKKAGPATAITLQSGTVVAVSFAAGVSTALAATRLHRRRRRIPPPASAGVTVSNDPPTDAVVQELHRAHLRAEHTDRDQAPPSDADLVKAAFSIDVPWSLPIGVTLNGTPCEISLAGLNLALTGPGADDAARAIILSLLTQADHHRVKIVIPLADATRLLGPAVSEIVEAGQELPGLTLTPSPEAAAALVGGILLDRARMVVDSDYDDVRQLLERDPGEVIPAVLLVTASQGSDTRHAPAPHGTARYGIGALTVGAGAGAGAGAGTCHVHTDGQVTAADGDLAWLRASRLFLVAPGDARALLRVLATGHQVIPEPSDTIEPAPAVIIPPPRTEQEPQGRPVRLLLLGVPTVLTGGQVLPLGRRGKPMELLTYLALHPDGATKGEIAARLWPDCEPGDRFHSCLRHLRDPLREATGSKKALFVHAEGDRYRIDPDTFSTDLWDFHHALAATRAATDDPTRTHALEQAITLIRGPLAQGAAYDWIDEERTPITRAQCDALAQLAELTEARDPERALNALEQARALDPDNEETYRRVIDLQIRLGRPDAATRTARLLKARLDELGLEPGPRTQEVISSVCRVRRTSTSSGKPAAQNRPGSG